MLVGRHPSKVEVAGSIPVVRFGGAERSAGTILGEQADPGPVPSRGRA